MKIKWTLTKFSFWDKTFKCSGVKKKKQYVEVTKRNTRVNYLKLPSLIFSRYSAHQKKCNNYDLSVCGKPFR